MGQFDDLISALENNTIDMGRFITELQNGLRNNTIDPKTIENAIFNGFMRGIDWKEKQQLKLANKAADVKSKATSRQDIWMAKQLEKQSEFLKKDIEFEKKHGYSREEANKAITNTIEQVAELGEKLVQGADAISNMWIFTYEKRIKETSNAYAKYEKEFQSELKRTSATISTMGVALSGIMNSNATKAQADLANRSKEEAKARIENVKSIQMANKEYAVATKETQIEYANKMADGGVAIAGSVAGILAVTAALAPATAGVSLAVGAVITGVAALGAGITKIVQKFKKVDLESEKLANEMYEKQMEHVSQTMDQMSEFVKSFEEIVDGTTELTRKNEESFKKLGVQLGYSGDSYAKYMRQISVETAKIFGLEAEQLMQMQSSYINSSGRNVLFDKDDFNDIEAISRVFGVSNQEVSAMMGEMNIFNTSIEDGYDMMNDMWHVATKLGLSTTKFSKDLTNNLKLAQKYNFKGGVENMAKLSMWAEKTRFNLSNATNFADKMMSNNIGDIMQTSAKLQVLGGNASIYADPLAMMWEAGNDVGALAKRMSAMIGDVTGTLDSETGETTFGYYEQQRLRAFADITGANYEDLLKEIRQRNKQGVINKVLAGYGLDDDILTGIGSRATYSKKEGKFKVKTIDGTEMGVEELAQRAKNGENIERLLLPENTDDAIMNIAKDVRSMAQKESANNLEQQTSLSISHYDEIQKASEKAIENQTRLFKLTEETGLLSDIIEQRIEVQNRKVEMLEKELNNPEVKAQVDAYYDSVKNNLMAGLQLSGEQTAYLRIMAKAVDGSGIEKISQYVSNAVAVSSMKKEKKRSEAANELINSAQVGSDEREIYESMLRQYVRVRDAIGSTNGGYLAGASVTPINDGVGTLVKTHPNDQFIAAKSGGPIDKLFDVVSTIISDNGKRGGGIDGDNKIKFELSGNINLNGSGSNVDLVSALKNDPIALRDFVRIMVKTMDSSMNGKVSKNHFI